MKYQIQDKEFTLAKVTPKRLATYCHVLGITDFLQMKQKEAIIDTGLRAMNVSMSPENVHQIMSACLNESLEGVDVGDLDLTLITQVINDFFLQQYPSLTVQPDV